MLSVIHIICRVVDKGRLRCTDVSFTCSLKRQTKLILIIITLLIIIMCSFTSQYFFCWPVVPFLSPALCTCAIIKASRSCPLPVKKDTSFFMSPVAMQYGMASSLSSAISWSALLQHGHTKPHSAAPAQHTHSVVPFLTTSWSMSLSHLCIKPT